VHSGPLLLSCLVYRGTARPIEAFHYFFFLFLLLLVSVSRVLQDDAAEASVTADPPAPATHLWGQARVKPWRLWCTCGCECGMQVVLGPWSSRPLTGSTRASPPVPHPLSPAAATGCPAQGLQRTSPPSVPTSSPSPLPSTVSPACAPPVRPAAGSTIACRQTPICKTAGMSSNASYR